MWMKAQSELRDFSEESAGLSRTRDEKEAAIRAQNAQPRIATWGVLPRDRTFAGAARRRQLNVFREKRTMFHLQL